MDEKPSEPISAIPKPEEKPRKKSSTIKSLILLVVCAGAFFWAYRAIREEMQTTAEMAKLVRSSEVAERMDGARQLGEVKPEDLERSVPLLLSTMTDPSELVREIVAWSLGNNVLTAMKAENKPASIEAARALSKLLGDENDKVRASAADAYDRVAKDSKPETFPIETAPVVSTLVGLLNDSTHEVRKNSGQALGSFATSLAIEPPTALIDGLAQLKQGDSRAQAALALGSFKTGTEGAVKALILALKDEDPQVRTYAAFSLRRFDLGAVPALPGLVALIDDPFVPPPPPPPPKVPFMAAVAGGAAGQLGASAPPPKVDPAVQAVRSIGQITEAQSAKGQTASAEVATGLLKALKSSRDDLKNAAVEVLQKVRKGASAIVPELILDLNESIPKPDSTFGPVAATILGDVGPESPKAADAIAALTSALDAKAPGTRANAIVSLGRFGPAAVAALPRIKELGEADKDLAASVKTATEKLEGKIPPDAPRRKGGGRGGRGGAPGGGGGGAPKAKGA